VGENHSCALLHDGSLRCWGANESGQLGDGTTIDRHRPVAIVAIGAVGPLREVALGGEHSCARTDAAVLCWGRNRHGQLGDGTTRDRPTPAPVKGLPGPVRQLALGQAHSCARDDQWIRCWGDNGSGAVGDGTRIDRPEPVLVLKP
jgi:alpha-tubulin suppressor-like RCC1 family protein